MGGVGFEPTRIATLDYTGNAFQRSVKIALETNTLTARSSALAYKANSMLYMILALYYSSTGNRTRTKCWKGTYPNH